jgi:hypothetical protein
VDSRGAIAPLIYGKARRTNPTFKLADCELDVRRMKKPPYVSLPGGVGQTALCFNSRQR